MSWQPFSLHFKQIFDGGYRYLDRCGEVMMLAEERLGLMPEDVSPSGCKMTLPEKGILLGMSSSELFLSQEFPKDGGEEFINICQCLTEMVSTFFQPRHVESNGFASKSFWNMHTAESSQSASLKLSNSLALSLVRDVDMVAQQEKIDCRFVAGNMNLTLKIEPVTFQSLTLNKFTPSPMSTGASKRRVERLNQRSKLSDNTLCQVLMMEVDLVEFDPPVAPLRNQLDLLKRKEQNLIKRFTIL